MSKFALSLLGNSDEMRFRFRRLFFFYFCEEKQGSSVCLEAARAQDRSTRAITYVLACYDVVDGLIHISYRQEQARHALGRFTHSCPCPLLGDHPESALPEAILLLSFNIYSGLAPDRYQ
jgi:hypothetical protein